jgi:hypothetical protein
MNQETMEPCKYRALQRTQCLRTAQADSGVQGTSAVTKAAHRIRESIYVHDLLFVGKN